MICPRLPFLSYLLVPIGKGTVFPRSRPETQVLNVNTVNTLNLTKLVRNGFVIFCLFVFNKVSPLKQSLLSLAPAGVEI